MDYGAFIVAMEQRRKWPAKRADVLWKELDARPELFADNEGPPPHCKRLKIPPKYLREDVSESEWEN